MINLSIKIWKYLSFFVIGLRLILPIFIFIDPFWIAIILFFLDWIDNPILLNSKLLQKDQYQKVDKFLDLYYLSALFIISLNWDYKILLILYSYRLIGFIIVLLTKNRKFFFLFINFFEPVYWLIAYAETKNNDFRDTLNNNLILFALIIILYKITTEARNHLLNGESLFFTFKVFRKTK